MRGRVEAGLAKGELTVALGVVALAFVVLWQAWSIPVSPIYAKVGPTLVPIMAGLGLLIFGLALVLSAVRGGWQPDEEKAITPDRRALGWVLAGLALNVLTIGPLGFTLASILLFVCVTRGFGSRNMLRDAWIGAVFALIAYLGFAKTLNINIGSGVIENGVEWVITMVRGH
ncbi:MAG: tripartite tricarboxylate transporter TctB family protein [Hyphomicrobiales bacterium]|nr:tripartite tricarboxylate transporter TctB family protein [Hyphomicrobiales bacterium]